MHPNNEFDDDPPTVASNFHYEKLPPPKLSISLDPYENYRLALAIWASRYWVHLIVVGEIIALTVAAAIASRLLGR